MGEESVITPRTKDERRAFFAGYAAALNDVDRNGMKFASGWLAQMTVFEGIVTQEEVDEVKKRG